MRRAIIGIGGASGVVYGVTILRLLRQRGIETHLVASKEGRMALQDVMSMAAADIKSCADFVYQPSNIAAPISSGSFATLGMIVAPCSTHTLAEIARGVTTSLLTRAADVVLKELRGLVLLTCEAPLHLGDIHNMAAATENGAIIYPVGDVHQKIDGEVERTASRVLDMLDIGS